MATLLSQGKNPNASLRRHPSLPRTQSIPYDDISPYAQNVRNEGKLCEPRSPRGSSSEPPYNESVKYYILERPATDAQLT